MLKTVLSLLLWMIVSILIHAAPTSSLAKPIEVDLFLSSTCPHCHKADIYFTRLSQQLPWLVVNRYFINLDKSALELFSQRLQQQNSRDFAVPAFFFCGAHWVGFDTVETTGKALFYALQYCHKNTTNIGLLKPVAAQTLQQWGIASQYQLNPAFTNHPMLIVLLTACAGAFSPCSWFSLSLLLAFIGLYSAEKKSIWALGLTYILVLGLWHFAEMVWIGFAAPPPIFRGIAILSGIILGLVVVKTYQTNLRKLPLKPEGLTYMALLLSSLVVWSYQQTCLYNISIVFEHWLITQPVSPVWWWAYQIAYQVLFFIPLLLFIMVCAIMTRLGWFIKIQPNLRLAGWIILLVIALLLLVYPSLLANFTLSWVILIGSVCASSLFNKFRPSTWS